MLKVSAKLLIFDIQIVFCVTKYFIFLLNKFTMKKYLSVTYLVRFIDFIYLNIHKVSYKSV